MYLGESLRTIRIELLAEPQPLLLPTEHSDEVLRDTTSECAKPTLPVDSKVGARP